MEIKLGIIDDFGVCKGLVYLEVLIGRVEVK